MVKQVQLLHHSLAKENCVLTSRRNSIGEHMVHSAIAQEAVLVRLHAAGMAGNFHAGRKLRAKRSKLFKMSIRKNGEFFLYTITKPVDELTIFESMIKCYMMEEIELLAKPMPEKYSIFSGLCEPMLDHQVNCFAPNKTAIIHLEVMRVSRNRAQIDKRSSSFHQTIGFLRRATSGQCKARASFEVRVKCHGFTRWLVFSRGNLRHLAVFNAE